MPNPLYEPISPTEPFDFRKLSEIENAKRRTKNLYGDRLGFTRDINSIPIPQEKLKPTDILVLLASTVLDPVEAAASIAEHKFGPNTAISVVRAANDPLGTAVDFIDSKLAKNKNTRYNFPPGEEGEKAWATAVLLGKDELQHAGVPRFRKTQRKALQALRNFKTREDYTNRPKDSSLYTGEGRKLWGTGMMTTVAPLKPELVDPGKLQFVRNGDSSSINVYYDGLPVSSIELYPDTGKVLGSLADPQARGKGIGKAMYKFAAQQGKNIYDLTDTSVDAANARYSAIQDLAKENFVKTKPIIVDRLNNATRSIENLGNRPNIPNIPKNPETSMKGADLRDKNAWFAPSKVRLAEDRASQKLDWINRVTRNLPSSSEYVPAEPELLDSYARVREQRDALVEDIFDLLDSLGDRNLNPDDRRMLIHRALRLPEFIQDPDYLRPPKPNYLTPRMENLRNEVGEFMHRLWQARNDNRIPSLSEAYDIAENAYGKDSWIIDQLSVIPRSQEIRTLPESELRRELLSTIESAFNRGQELSNSANRIREAYTNFAMYQEPIPDDVRAMAERMPDTYTVFNTPHVNPRTHNPRTLEFSRTISNVHHLLRRLLDSAQDEETIRAVRGLLNRFDMPSKPK